MADVEPTRVEVSRRIGAGAGEIFRLLSDPRRHIEIDGSGMLRGAITDEVVSQLGDVFAMRMYYQQFGDYEMSNRIVEYVPDRLIAWEPSRRDIEEEPWHHRWGFGLEPDGPHAVVVTEFFDCSRAPDEGKQAVRNGTVWIEAMTATLERLVPRQPTFARIETARGCSKLELPRRPLSQATSTRREVSVTHRCHPVVVPRVRHPGSPAVVHRVAPVALRTTACQQRRLVGLLSSAGDVWACVLCYNDFVARRGGRRVVKYQGLCRLLAESGPGTFGELDSVGARSVLRRYADAYINAAGARRKGDMSARFPRRRRRFVPVRYYEGTFSIEGRRVRLPVSRGCAPLFVRLSRDVPYPLEQVRSLTLLMREGRLYLDVCAEVPVATYPEDLGPEPSRVAGVDLGVIHPYAVAGPDNKALLVSGRALRAESRLALAEQKSRSAALSGRAPRKGTAGSRRWRKSAERTKRLVARHRRRLSQARHEAAKEVVSFAITGRIGTLVIGDPTGVLDNKSGRNHNKRVRDWRPGQLISCLRDKAEQAGISVVVCDERTTSSTCPSCRRRVAKPAGRRFSCSSCGLVGHRDLVGAVNIAARVPGGGDTVSMPETLTHRRGGRHLPGAGRSRRDPRRTRWQIERERARVLARRGPPREGNPAGSSSSVRFTAGEDPLTGASE